MSITQPTPSGPVGRRCVLVHSAEPAAIEDRRALRRGIEDAGYFIVGVGDGDRRSADASLALALTDAACVAVEDGISDTFRDLAVAIARGMQKPTLYALRAGVPWPFDFDAPTRDVVRYESTTDGRRELARATTASLVRFRNPSALLRPRGVASPSPFTVDWERLEPRERENLCRELLIQLGYRQVSWAAKTSEIDIVAELAKPDPDGFEQKETWLISIGHELPKEFVGMLVREPEYLLTRILRSDVGGIDLSRRDLGSLTFLYIALDEGPATTSALMDLERTRIVRSVRGPSPIAPIRVRVWSRAVVTGLVNRFPQIGYKYFAEEQRRLASHRQTLEQMYKENVELSSKQVELIRQLEEEKGRRIRAERDSAWKDISFTAAHKLGNPIFAIETNLDPLRKRIMESRVDEAKEVVDEIGLSVDKAKDIIDQFKSLTKLQELAPEKIRLRPILEHSCDLAKHKGIRCEIDCAPDLDSFADPVRIAECFDELVRNGMHWVSTQVHGEIRISVTSLTSGAELPRADIQIPCLRIVFEDNGSGVPPEKKERIFDAFFTTRDQGTGLGLAIVRRIVEGHGGAILETGTLGKGARFEIYLPTRVALVDAASAAPNGESAMVRKAATS